MTNVPKNALQTLERVQAELHKRKGELGRWEDVAHEIGVSLGTVCRVARGYYPRHPELCHKFGLPELQNAVACSVCRIVHVSKRCPARKKVVRSRRNWKALSLLLAGVLCLRD